MDEIEYRFNDTPRDQWYPFAAPADQAKGATGKAVDILRNAAHTGSELTSITLTYSDGSTTTFRRTRY